MIPIQVNALLYKAFGGGVEKAIFSLVRELLREDERSTGQLRVFGSRDLSCLASKEKADESLKIIGCRCPTRIERIVREQVLVLFGGNYRLWHHLGYVMPFFRSRAKTVVSVYDIIALTHPHLCTRLNRLFYHTMLPRTFHHADLLIVPSRYVKEQISERFPSAEERIEILPLPLSDLVIEAHAICPGNGESSPDQRLPRTGVLYVGNLGPKKNFEFLIRCYASLPPEIRAKHPLTVCGNHPRQEKTYARLMRFLEVERDAQFLGYLNEENLIGQYRRARVLTYPSLVEGYGFPPLEAMAFGTPAVVSDRGSLPEIAGSKGAVVSPLRQEIFSAALLRLLTDDDWHSVCAERGRAAVSRFRWRDYAGKLMELYERLY